MTANRFMPAGKAWPCPETRHQARSEADLLDRMAAALREALPKDMCLCNPRRADSTTVPLAATLGELRQLAALLWEYDSLRVSAPLREPVLSSACPKP